MQAPMHSRPCPARPNRISALRAALAAVVLAMTGGTASAAGDQVVFYDGSFGGSWTSTKIVDTTPGASATFASVTTLADGGLPPCRQTTHNYDSGVIVVAHVDANSNYDPSTGPICSIDGAYDLIHYTAPNGAVRYRLLIVQNGTYYHDASGTDVFPNLWGSYVVTGLTSASFVRVAGTGPERPDFSCSGGSMTFGFTTSNSASTGPNTKVSAIDNWSLTLNVARKTIFDGDFSGTYTSLKILDTTPGGAATWSTLTQPVAGSPGAYREISHTLANGAIAVLHYDPASQYDPTQMPVYEVSCSYTLRHFTPALGAVRFHVAVLQNGFVFVAPWDDVYPDAWSQFSHPGLIADDFTNYLGGLPAHPDFTSSGTPFILGFVTSNSVNGGPVTKFAGIDNWNVVLHLAPRCTTSVGTPYCFGDNSFLSCPCFPAVPAGLSGRGCPNSLFPSGALLIAQGTPSIGNDTLVLRGSGMPNSSCLYFQGTAQITAGLLDGLRCAGGSVIRLATHTNMCNSSEHPSSIDQRISVQGLVPPGGLRFYQAWYRNAAAFCTSSTANLTNGIAINWTL